MSNIHPDWQSEEDVPVPVTVKDEENASVQISRRPAAIVGMLLVVGIAIYEANVIKSALFVVIQASV